MNQPIDVSPPWWDGTISINFSVEEWQGILTELRMLYQVPGFPANKQDEMLEEIMITITKNIEV